MSTPPFQIPSGAVANLYIIDTTGTIENLGAEHLVKPDLSSFTVFPTIPSWSFLIETTTAAATDSGSPRRVLFDLGIPKDIPGLPPSVSDRLANSGYVIEIPKTTAEVLKESASSLGQNRPLELKDIEAVVWRGRRLRELNFSGTDQSTKIGKIPAMDYFGDGSFYLLDTPGHAVGHLGGLVRTTKNPDTFVFLGGDLTHHGGELRPSEFLSLESASKDVAASSSSSSSSEGCSDRQQVTVQKTLESLQTSRGRRVDQAFFDPVITADEQQALQTIARTQEADAQENVYYIAAHDLPIREVVDFFPNKANGWKERGWREKTLWTFLRDFRGSFESNKEAFRQAYLQCPGC
ncbi:hypothetical protein LTS17_002169 [Exophiala oligosperma]